MKRDYKVDIRIVTRIEANTQEEAESIAKALVKGDVEEGTQVDRFYDDLSKASIYIFGYDSEKGSMRF